MSIQENCPNVTVVALVAWYLGPCWSGASGRRCLPSNVGSPAHPSPAQPAQSPSPRTQAAAAAAAAAATFFFPRPLFALWPPLPCPRPLKSCFPFAESLRFSLRLFSINFFTLFLFLDRIPPAALDLFISSHRNPSFAILILGGLCFARCIDFNSCEIESRATTTMLVEVSVNHLSHRLLLFIPSRVYFSFSSPCPC